VVRLVFLGRLEDLAGALERDIPLAAPTPLADVLATLPADLAAALTASRIRLARNGTLTPAEGLTVSPNDELAFLPPVSGG
jgi:molybdopterin synthase sulfur carrier subunit